MDPLASNSTGMGMVSAWSSSTRAPDDRRALAPRGGPRELLGRSTSLGTITEKNGCPILSVRRATVCMVSVSAIVNCSTLPASSVLLKFEFERVNPPSLFQPAYGVFARASAST